MKQAFRVPIIRALTIILLFVGILLFFYPGLGEVYFQQDEWHKIGKAMYYTHVDFLDIFKQKFGFHFIPLATFYYMAGYVLFGLNAHQYLFAGLLLQAVAGYLVFSLLRRLFASEFPAIVLSVLFLINPGIHQVMLNEMVSLYTLSFICSLSVFILAFDGLKDKVFARKRLILMCLLSVAAFMMLEVWASLFVLVPLFMLLCKPKDKLPVFGVTHRNVYVLALVSIVIIFVFGRTLSSPTPVPNSAPMKLSLAYNAITLPMKFVVEYATGLRNVYTWASYFQRHISYYRADPSVNQDLMAVTTGYEVIVYFVFAIIAVLTAVLIAMSRKEKSTDRNLKILLFAMFWLVVLGTTISPQGRFFMAPESRYMYLSAFGVILAQATLFMMIRIIAGRFRYGRVLMGIAVSGYLLFWGTYAYRSIDTELAQVIKISRVRKSIVSQILNIQPELPKRTIVYLYCSDGCIANTTFGQLSEWVVPFQNGFGWTLLTYFARNDPEQYAIFFRDLYFWERLAVGYREVNGIGFGYVNTYADMVKLQKIHAISNDDVVILEYDSGLNRVRKIKYDEYLRTYKPNI